MSALNDSLGRNNNPYSETLKYFHKSVVDTREKIMKPTKQVIRFEEPAKRCTRFI